MRRIVSFILTASLALAAAGCTDYQAGYQRGQEEARKLRKELGPLAKPAHDFAEGLGIEPAVDDKSDAWNRGFRQGARDEMAR